MGKKKIEECIIDETAVKVGSELIWFWVAIEPKDKEILSTNISKERNMFVAERFISKVIKEYGKHPISTDRGTWYPQAYRFLKLDHYIHFLYTRIKKALLKELCSILRIEPKSLTIIFLAKRTSVN